MSASPSAHRNDNYAIRSICHIRILLFQLVQFLKSMPIFLASSDNHDDLQIDLTKRKQLKLNTTK